jgi:hypothetical protein
MYKSKVNDGGVGCPRGIASVANEQPFFSAPIRYVPFVDTTHLACSHQIATKRLTNRTGLTTAKESWLVRTGKRQQLMPNDYVNGGVLCDG